MLIKTKTKTVTEPIGSAAPKFSQETKSLSFVKPVDITLSLLCAAQGAPLPSYRLAKKRNLKNFLGTKNNWWFEQLNKSLKHKHREQLQKSLNW